MAVDRKGAFSTHRPANAAGKIARSVRSDVHFSDGDLMLIEHRAERPAFRSPTFEIKKDVAQAVVWCD